MPRPTEGEDYWEALYDKARVCVAAGMQPSEYDRLTDDERDVFVDVINDINKPHD